MYDERFQYEYLPDAGDNRGYSVTMDVFMDGHSNCGCMRGQVVERIYVFLPHSDGYHGHYPMQVTSHAEWLHRLQLQCRREVPDVNAKIGSRISYGAKFEIGR